MVLMTAWRGSDPKNMLIIPTESIITLSANEETCIFVTVTGKLFIGHYNGEDRGSLKEVELGDLFIEDAAIYKNKIIFIAERGNVYSYDPSSENFVFIPILEPKKTCSHGKEEDGRRVAIQKVSAGLDHVLFLSTKHELWVQGKGPALGLFTNKIENELTYPTRVEFFKDRKVLDGKAGSYFTVALVEALPPLLKHTSDTNDNSPDLDSCVRSCELCQKETGDRVLFEDIDEMEKCPLGIKINTDSYDKVDFLSPTYSSTCLDERSSRASNPFENSTLACYGQDESEILSDEQSCSEDASPSHSKVEIEMKNIGECTPTSNLFSKADSAKQFFSKPLSWVTHNSIDSEYTNIESDRFSYKYPFDTATELIKENVASAASLVATSVRTVGDKVNRLSQHFSVSVESVEDSDIDYLTPSEYLSKDALSIPPTNMKKSESYEENTFPRCTSSLSSRKSHIRTGSIGFNHTKITSGLFYSEKNCAQIESCRDQLIENGKTILNSEVWGWGSSNRGQLGLGDHTHRPTPTNVASLNHVGIIKVVNGSHHTAALSVDGQVFVWGNNSSGQIGPSKQATVDVPELLSLPEGKLGRDIGSGDDYLIIISSDGKIYYVGTQNEDELASIKEIYISDMSATFSSVLSQSHSIICRSGDVHPKVVSFFHLDALYLSDLKNAAYRIILPILNLLKNTPNNVVNNNIKSSLSNLSALSNQGSGIPTQSKILKTKTSLLEAYLSITYATTSSLYYIWKESTDVSSILPITNKVDELVLLYQDYLNLLCDTIAINGLILESKEAEGIIEKNRNCFESLIPPNKGKSNADLLAYILLHPIERVGEYEKFLFGIKEDTSLFYSPFTRDKIKHAHTQWRKLSIVVQNSKAEAEQTRAFWLTCSPKLFETLASPSRRVILDSRKCAVNLHKAGRFSSHSFTLLSDVLIHYMYSSFNTYKLSTMWVESLNNLTGNQNIIQITQPEETLTLTCPTHAEKGKWLNALQDSIKKCIQVPGDTQYKPLSPPLVRNATYVFSKTPQYKDATYAGQWFCGKMHGEGSLTWPEGRRYIGQFRHNVYQGFGRLEILTELGVDTYEGCWKNGKIEGRGIIRYANRDIYLGFLHNSLPNGHGELKKGKFSSEAASVYTGEWLNGARHGYGVLDDIAHGEKYHGIWQSNSRHGLGMVVTMNDVYYEGNFIQNKLSGPGLMILEDDTHFEGELGPGGSYNGKGILRYPSGDYIEGTFSGMWNEGAKINGMLYKDAVPSNEASLPKSFGRLTVNAELKWASLFKHCEEQLGISGHIHPTTTSKIWDALASFIESEKQAVLRSKGSLDPLDGLDKIFDVREDLSLESYYEIMEYLEKAFSRSLHPLGQLMHSLVGAFRATYGGVVSHPRLLQYAVREVKSFTSRLYRIVRFLFPELPSQHSILILEDENHPHDDIIVTETRVIQPRLLPHIYSSLSPLYVKSHQRNDHDYWQRLLKWNKQTDIALMAFLGVDMQVWLTEGRKQAENQSLATIKEKHFIDAIETLQLLSTSFTPKDKLLLIYKCALKIEEEVQQSLGKNFKLSMDELLPIFIYVVVRARIQHLGAEIGFICDLMDPDLQNGKLEHIFTTLEASYQYILHENATR